MKRLFYGLGIVVVMFGLSSCNAKVEPVEETPSGASSLDITFSPSSLELVPGESGEVSYRYSQIVTSPRIVLIPVAGLQMSSAPDPGGQSGKIQVTLSADVALGTVLTASVVAADGDKSVQKTLEVKAKGPDPITPVDPSSKRQIRTIKIKEGSNTYHYAWFKYDTQNRVSRATLSQSGKYTINVDYSYPTQSSIEAMIDDDFSFVFFISNGQLLSITESDGDKWNFEYDQSGRLSRSDMNRASYTWSGNDIVSFSTEYDFVEELSYSQSQDKYGFSFLLGISEGDLDELEEYFMAPILSRVSGINSEHLVQTISFSGSDSSGMPNSSIHLDYSLDEKGYPKTILTDNGYTLYLWYTDEPESADENLGGGGQGGGGGEDGPETGSSAWSVIGDVMDSGWSRDYYGVDLGGGIVALKNVTLTASDMFKWRKDGSWNENYGGSFVSLNQGFSVSMDGDNIIPYLSGTYDLYLNTSLEQAAVCTKGASPNWSYPPSGGILDVSGSEFWSQITPSSTQLYRLRGVIDYISDSTYGNFWIKTEDGYFIYIYGASSSPIGYGGTPDKTFASRRLRRGDEITMVGYAYEYDGYNEMNYGYVESSYRLKMSDFEGTYRIYFDMEEYSDGTYYFDGASINITDSNLEVHGLDGYSSEHLSYWPSAAIGEYDDETGCITLIGGYFRSDWSWYYTSDPDQRYMSIFWPVYADSNNQSYEYYTQVQFGGYNAQGTITLQPRSEFRGSGAFGLERAGTASDSQYIFIDYYYDADSGTVGEGQYRSEVWQLWYMQMDAGTKSSTLPKSLTGDPVRKTPVRPSGIPVPHSVSR